MIKLTFKGVAGTPDRTDWFEGVELEYEQNLYADGTLWATFEDGFWRLAQVDGGGRYASFTADSGAAPPAKASRFEVRLRRVTTEHVTVIVDEEDVTDDKEAHDYVEDRLADEDWEPIAEGGDPTFGPWEIDYVTPVQGS